MTSKTQVDCTSDPSAVHPFSSAEVNRKASQNAWSFYQLTAAKRAEAARRKAWPCPPSPASFEIVD